jgi:4-diphosphocytidyl-2-C-methyl-D-erythritol kinase
VSQPLATRAPAKINLTLHVLGRREDGYHTLESLVAFAGTGDSLTLVPGAGLSLTVEGPTASGAGAIAENLVLKAARLLSERVEGLRLGAFSLVKRLPVAAGIGGGSSDAAAALRLLARLNGLSPDHPVVREAARLTGSDVPVCLDPRMRMMRGVGEELGPPLGLPPLFAVLVNPRLPVETPAVFRRLGLEAGERLGRPAHPRVGGMKAGLLARILAETRNDLEAPAIALQPIVGEVLARVGETEGVLLARMSGSGATVFGLYGDRRSAAAAARSMRRSAPDWWIKATILR